MDDWNLHPRRNAASETAPNNKRPLDQTKLDSREPFMDDTGRLWPKTITLACGASPAECPSSDCLRYESRISIPAVTKRATAVVSVIGVLVLSGCGGSSHAKPRLADALACAPHSIGPNPNPTGGDVFYNGKVYKSCSPKG